ncbi:MAG: YCF48-related protein, partial [Phycisphaerae bacterium]
MTTRFAASGLHAVSLTISVALLAAAPAFAQLVTQSPKPTGRNLEGVAFVSPTHGFVVGQNHHLLETFDGGLTWTTRMATALSTDPFYTIHFHDALHGYIGGNNQDAYRTTDGGATWTQMTSMLPGSVRSFDFITPTTGFVGYNGAIAWTPDGGDTWQARAVYPDAPIVYELSFADELVGVASGHRSTPHHDSGIYRTTDGGWTWTLVHDAGGPFVRLDAQSIICPTGIDVVRSDDGGQTWYFISPNGTPTSVSGLTRLGNSDVLIGVSFSGDIIRSPDLGVSWSHDVIGIGVLPALWACTAYDEQSAWVTGANGLTYRTTNAGQNWLLLNSGCGDEVTGIDFADDDFGVAVTHRGFVFRTENRGASWITSRLIETGIVFGREEGFRAVDVVNRDFVIAGGAGGILFRTDDGGESWTSVGWPHQPGFSGGFEIRAIRFTDPLNGWLGGFSDPSVFRSFDGGWSWTPVPEIGGAIVAIDADGQRVWVSTAGNVVHRSFNDGQSWTSTTMPGNVYYLNDLE